MSLGGYIKKLRIENKLSQRELADICGVSNTEICRLEGGSRKKPSIKTLVTMAPYLSVSHVDLMRRTGYLDEDAPEQDVIVRTIYRDENGKPFVLAKRAIEMYEKDSEWAMLAFKVVDSGLSDYELDIICVQT